MHEHPAFEYVSAPNTHDYVVQPSAAKRFVSKHKWNSFEAHSAHALGHLSHAVVVQALPEDDTIFFERIPLGELEESTLAAFVEINPDYVDTILDYVQRGLFVRVSLLGGAQPVLIVQYTRLHLSSTFFWLQIFACVATSSDLQ